MSRARLISELAAHHEAGHALVAVQVGARVSSLTIDPDWDDGPQRYADTTVEWPLDAFTEREFCEKSVRVSLAGPVAEMLYTREPYHPGMVAEWARDWQMAWKSAEPLYPEERLRLAYLERTSVELYRWLDRDDNWAGLAAIVDALLAHETLDGEQIEEILEPWWP